MAVPAGNHDEPSLASLIERSAELKRALVGFALSPRFERQMERFVLESGSDEIPDEGEAIDAIDRFALQHTLPNGKTVLGQFLASRPDLTAADREMLRGWRDPVEGIFEIRRKDRDSLVLLNLLDDLEYRTYSNTGPAAFRPLPKHGFVQARLIPLRPVPDAWLASGSMRAYRKSAAADVAQAALARQPARRRPRHVVGVDMPALELPPELADADTIGVIYDDTDGLNFYNEYGGLRDLFADPALAADKRYADVLRGYLGAETIGPLPFRRLAAAHPQTVNAVFRKVLRQQNFTWAEHGEALLRRRKPWYYEHEPRPDISVLGARLSELLRQ